MFAYCGDNPVVRVDSNGQFFITATAVAEIGMVVSGIIGLLLITDYTVKNPPKLPSISSSKIGIKPKVEEKSKADEKDKTITSPPSRKGVKYYHVTTPGNALSIMKSEIMFGSEWEGGHVYAWKENPSKYAIKNSGAHTGVTISFKTNTPFVMDTGITDPKVQMYGPVVSVVSGPIIVWDVQIVG